MNSHIRNAVHKARKAEKKHVRQEVRDILKLIQEDPNLIDEKIDHTYLDWEKTSA